MNNPAWNNDLGTVDLIRCDSRLIHDRKGRGCSYWAARGEILGLAQDDRRRKHSSITCPLIKNESWGIEND